MPQPYSRLMQIRQAPLQLIYRTILPFFLLAFTWLLYGNSLEAAFHFDDINYIVDAPLLRTPYLLFQSLLNGFFVPGRQLTALSFAFNHHFHGLDVAGYHTVNITLHAINGYLLYLILQKLLTLTNPGKHALLATATTLLFLSHPVAVNSVTYIAQRHVLLATLFYFMGFYCFLRCRYGGSTVIYKTLWALAALIAYWAAIHAKSMALTLPLLCLLTDIVFSSGQKNISQRKIRFTIIFVLFFFSGLLIYTYFDGLFSKAISSVGFRAENLWSPWVHFLTESVVFLHYWKILLIPWTGWLNVDHHFQLVQSFWDLKVLLSIGAHLIIICCGIFAASKRYLLASIGIFWFYIILSPYFFVPILDVMVEYKTYPALPALLLIAVDFLKRIKSRKSHYALFSTFLIILVFFCMGTIKRNKVMATEISFWSDAILKDPVNYRAYNNLGIAYYNENRPDLALIEYKKALDISPGYLFAIANAGDSLLKIGKNKEALKLYKIVIEHDSNNAAIYFKAGTASGNLSLWDDALVYFKKAIKLDRYYVAAWHNLGLTLGHLGMWKESKSVFERVIRFKPYHFEAYSNLGVTYLRLSQRTKAEKAFEKSVSISPSFAEGHYKLSLFYASDGKRKEAMEELQIVQKLDKKLANQLKKILLR